MLGSSVLDCDIPSPKRNLYFKRICIAYFKVQFGNNLLWNCFPNDFYVNYAIAPKFSVFICAWMVIVLTENKLSCIKITHCIRLLTHRHFVFISTCPQKIYVYPQKIYNPDLALQFMHFLLKNPISKPKCMSKFKLNLKILEQTLKRQKIRGCYDPVMR